MALENHPDVAMMNGCVCYVGAADLDASQIWRRETRDQPKRCGLAASRRPKQRHEFAIRDPQAHRIDNRNAAIEFRDLVQRHRSHRQAPATDRRPTVRSMIKAAAAVTAISMVEIAAIEGSKLYST